MTIELFIQQLINGISIGFAYALIAMGLTLILGILDVINFAHGEFYMLGAYGLFLGVSMLGLGFISSMIFSILLVAIIVFIIYQIVLNRVIEKDQMNAMLATFAISTLLINTINAIYAKPVNVISPFEGSIQVGGITITKSSIVIIITSVIVIIMLKLLLDYTNIGKQIKATGQHKTASLIMGIKVNRIYLYTFLIGAALAALAGMFLGTVTTIYPSMGQTVNLTAFAVVILGGMGNIYGALIAALLIGIFESFGAVFLPGSWNASIAFIILVLTLLIRPQGIFGGIR